ncbi:hypothetical protein HKX48_008545 [Thoreauomyces humboldtii]|nr:hypothetical protein HKX48_008545 [Thoreauomyces humboldtii]
MSSSLSVKQPAASASASSQQQQPSSSQGQQQQQQPQSAAPSSVSSPSANPLPSAKDQAAARAILRRLVSLVARAYYEPKHIVLLDLLLKVNSHRDDDLAKALRVQSKELHKICGKLKTDGLVKSEARAELVGPVVEGRQQRKINRQYYYIDYKLFVDVVKWKIFRIGKMIEKEVQMQMANMPYKCPQCTKEYSALDFAMLSKTADMRPLCDVCGVMIEEGSSGVDSTGVSEKYTKFMNESQPIVDLLKQTDRLIIPEWVSDAGDPSLAADGSGRDGEAGQGELGFSTEMGAAPANIVIEVDEADKERRDAEELNGVFDAAIGGDDQATSLAEYYRNLAAQQTEAAIPPPPSSTQTAGSKRNRGNDDDEDEDEDFDEVMPTMAKTQAAPPPAPTKVESEEDEDFEEI